MCQARSSQGPALMGPTVHDSSHNHTDQMENGAEFWDFEEEICGANGANGVLAWSGREGRLLRGRLAGWKGINQGKR